MSMRESLNLQKYVREGQNKQDQYVQQGVIGRNSACAEQQIYKNTYVKVRISKINTYSGACCAENERAQNFKRQTKGKTTGNTNAKQR